MVLLQLIRNVADLTDMGSITIARDISMDYAYGRELLSVLGEKQTVRLPQVFIKGKYIGGVLRSVMLVAMFDSSLLRIVVKQEVL
ncbi:hypothetical protein L2E82_29738 [Cichorium intybus]|uniref:Uncharacterized protein n=1 Tax=Cichorium intybus TaxID=13427 RepID=A0ACB9CYG9_CICIN|nr:hypothetical protein L2E82_29738 [Cichorium intybus]